MTDMQIIFTLFWGGVALVIFALWLIAKKQAEQKRGK